MTDSKFVAMSSTTVPKLVRFSLRLQKDFLSQIQAEATARNASVNDVLNRAVAEYLDAEDACWCCGKPL